MKIKAYPSSALRGEVTSRQPPALPGDKSISHRAILLSALASGESRVGNLLIAGVTLPLLNALTALGIPWELTGSTLSVVGRGLDGFSAPQEVLDCGNSGTSLRLLAGTLAAAGVPAVLDGTPGLRRRPMGRIVEPLQSMGVPISASAEGTAPLRLAARPHGTALRPLDYTLPVASAQVKSCLLLAALAANGDSTLREPGPSRDHTERMLAGMGVSIKTGPGWVTLQPPTSNLPPLNFDIPGDFSAAAFLIVAALITPDSDITLRGVGLNPTRTGLLEVLQAMQADIAVEYLHANHGEPVGDLRVRYSALQAVQVRGDTVVRMIDEFPIFAIAAAYAQGESVVSEAEELRYKESDRIAAMCQELGKIGVSAHETSNGFVITGGGVRGGQVQSHGDHRLAMSLAVAGLAALEPVQVNDAEMSDESFPGFVETLQALGAHLETQGSLSQGAVE